MSLACGIASANHLADQRVTSAGDVDIGDDVDPAMSPRRFDLDVEEFDRGYFLQQ